MSGVHVFTQYVRERLRTAGFPAFVAGSDDMRDAPPVAQMHGLWVLIPTECQYQQYDLTEAKTRVTWTLVGLWSGVGTDITAKALAGKRRAIAALQSGERPDEVLEVFVPYEGQPIETRDGATEIAFRIHTTLLEV